MLTKMMLDSDQPVGPLGDVIRGALEQAVKQDPELEKIGRERISKQRAVAIEDVRGWVTSNFTIPPHGKKRSTEATAFFEGAGVVLADLLKWLNQQEQEREA